MMMLLRTCGCRHTGHGKLQNMWKGMKVLQHLTKLCKFSTRHVIDLRSDTVTKPSPAMRERIMNAVVGDDVYGEDPTVRELQDFAAKLFNKEAALFVPTGTMGNLISVMSQCSRRGEEILVGDMSHICLYEQGNVAQIAGVHPRTVQNHADGTLDMTDLRRKIRVTDDVHQPLTRLICTENTHNMLGGKVLQPEYLESLSELAREHELAVHCDGARMMNAAVALNCRVSELLNFCDSVSVCLSKGLGAPVGSVIAGSGIFVERSLRIRKSLGGGLRQCGILAAAGLMALEEAEKTLSADHENAQILANSIKKLDSPLLRIDPEDVHTNILVVNLPNEETLSAKTFCDKLQQVGEDEGVSVLALPAALPTQVRLVTHKDVSREDVEMAADKIQWIVKEYS